MRRIATLLLTVLLAAPVVGWSAGNPLVGRWDFNMTTGNRTSALWLGVTGERPAPTMSGTSPPAATVIS